MINLFQDYLKYNETAWSATTMKSEASRLRALSPAYLKGPEHVYQLLSQQGRKPYGIKTALLRLAAVEAWGASQGREDSSLGYVEFMRRHRNRFKHVYAKEVLTIDYAQALTKIEGMQSPFKEAALTLLENGLRISELGTIDENGYVLGKGGKRRKLYGKIYIGRTNIPPKSTLTAKLKAVGLKAHTLRKLCATKVAMRGASAADLCFIFGWTDISVAYQYLAPIGDDKLRELVSS